MQPGPRCCRHPAPPPWQHWMGTSRCVDLGMQPGPRCCRHPAPPPWQHWMGTSRCVDLGMQPGPRCCRHPAPPPWQLRVRTLQSRCCRPCPRWDRCAGSGREALAPQPQHYHGSPQSRRPHSRRRTGVGAARGASPWSSLRWSFHKRVCLQGPSRYHLTRRPRRYPSHAGADDVAGAERVTCGRGGNKHNPHHSRSPPPWERRYRAGIRRSNEAWRLQTILQRPPSTQPCSPRHHRRPPAGSPRCRRQ